jgi:hypothetical protein
MGRRRFAAIEVTGPSFGVLRARAPPPEIARFSKSKNRSLVWLPGPRISMIPATAANKPSVVWPAAKVEIWPIEKLTANPCNARIHNPEQIEQIRASLRASE